MITGYMTAWTGHAHQTQFITGLQGLGMNEGTSQFLEAGLSFAPGIYALGKAGVLHLSTAWSMASKSEMFAMGSTAIRQTIIENIKASQLARATSLL